MALIDSYGRKINYLRLSVTDRCNLRCRYCMPEEGISKLRHAEILSYEQMLMLAQASVQVGIEKIRVTGGEPLVRNGIIDFLKNLSAIPGLRQLVLTTNGILLKEMAADLKNAGVQRLNISLDSLRPEVFKQITRFDYLDRVLTGIQVAEELGFPIKINVVAMRGVNDAEFIDFAKMTLNKPYAVRFIEYMPTSKEESWQSLVIPGDEILERIAKQYPMKPVVRSALSGPSQDYRIDGAAGTLGIITAISEHFCSECNRIRVTSAGMARSCLFDDTEFDLKPFLRKGGEAELAETLRSIVMGKPQKHLMSNHDAAHEPFDMSKIGG
ncbi:MAG: moaA [Geobacteraceae bacterium]|nr:moaA [Geobacteraceae bacterium]